MDDEPGSKHYSQYALNIKSTSLTVLQLNFNLIPGTDPTV